MIDYIVFYAVSAIFRSYNGGTRDLEKANTWTLEEGHTGIDS